MAKSVNTPEFVHLEQDEVYPFKSAYEATAEQLRMARGLYHDVTGNDQPSEAVVVAVLNAFATNFAAMTISRKLTLGDD